MVVGISFDASGRRVVRYERSAQIRNVLVAGGVAVVVLSSLTWLLFAVAGPIAIPVGIVVATLTFSLGGANALYFMLLRPYWPDLTRSRRWGAAALVSLVHAGPMFSLFFAAVGVSLLWVVPLVVIWTAAIYFQTRFRFERNPWAGVASANSPEVTR